MLEATSGMILYFDDYRNLNLSNNEIRGLNILRDG